MKLSNSFKKLLVASVVVVLLFVVGLFFWNLRFHITGTNPPLSSVDFVIPYIDVTFNKSLDPKSAVVNSSSPVKAYAVVGSKDLRIYLQAPMTANKSYTLLIKSIESSGNSLLINQKLTFVARNVDFNQLTPAEQKEIINEQSQFPPSMEDPILSHLPYGTLDYNLTDSYQTVGGKTKLILVPLVWYGTDSQKKKYLPKLATGEWVAAYALSEATSGSDAMNIRTKATLSADGTEYILNGEKMWISNCGFADLYTVFAKIDGEKFSAFLIERNTPGLSVGKEEHKLGIRGSSTCPLILNDCRVPVENLLGEIGKGHHIAFNILNMGRFKLGAAAVGGARNSFDGLQYAKERKAFGKPIAEFGLVQEKLADCATGIYVGESLSYRTIGMIDAALADVDAHATGASRDIQKKIEEYAGSAPS